MAYQIDKGVPMPPISRGKGRLVYPWDEMEVGDSFFVKDGKVKTLSRSCGTYGKRLERKFTSRTVEGGARVWRVE